MRNSIVKNQIRLWLLPLLMFVIASPLAGQEERQDERPDTAKLLPETTQMYVEIGNIREFMEKMQETGMGQVFENEKVADLVDNLYTDMAENYEDIKEDVGLGLEDFQDLPQGEISFAIIAPKRDDLQYVFFMEVDSESDAFNNVMNRSREVAERLVNHRWSKRPKTLPSKRLLLMACSLRLFKKMDCS